MIRGARLGHFNVVAHDWRKLGAFYQALKVHDGAWRARRRYLSDATAPDVAKYHYPELPLLGDRGRVRIDHPHCNVKFVAFDSKPVSLDAFTAHHAELSTEPTSLFVSFLLAHRRDDTGVDSMIGLVLARIEADRTQQVLDDRDDWFDALDDIFGVSLLDVDADRRDALWSKTNAAHEAWSAG